MPEIENIVEVKDLSFSYDSERVLTNINLNIPRGDFLGIIGPNGAGKTTLLKIMLGLLHPQKGSIKLFGQDVSDFKDWAKIGYVPQKVTNFDANFPATVQEVVLMGRYARRGLFKKVTAEDRAIAKSSLEQVEMWAYRDKLIGDLSGGQQQRVFIARALATKPEIIFLDEPTTGVDQKTQDEFYRILKKLNQDFGLTLVLISHDVEVVMSEAKHIACIDRKLICHLPPSELAKDAELSRLFEGEAKIITHGHGH